jgi:hypothetical protein
MRFLILAAAWVLAACNMAPNSAGQISERIGLVANDPSTKELDLTRLMTFGWDRLHLFKAGTTREALCAFLNAGRNACGRVVRYEVVPADHVAMLFTLGDQLTHLELHALANGVLDVSSPPGGLPREACVFTVRHVASTGTAPVAMLELR